MFALLRRAMYQIYIYTFNGACLPGTVFVLADTYPAGMLIPEIIVILYTQYCLSDLVPSFMTGNQCG